MKHFTVIIKTFDSADEETIKESLSDQLLEDNWYNIEVESVKEIKEV